MGDDLRVANAARVSFGKESEAFDGKDEKLINYLAEHGHWTPFAHCFLTFRIKAPIFVARQLGKHQVGLVWNEVSRRYVDSEPEFYVPEGWRKRAENVKQGSSNELADLTDLGSAYSPEYSQDRAVLVYNRLLSMGVCPEQARMVLPQSMYTEWYWSGSLIAFHRVCELRLDPHTQRETQEVARQIYHLSCSKFPVSWGALSRKD
jgi:thymidylate synthase (FAD)